MAQRCAPALLLTMGCGAAVADATLPSTDIVITDSLPPSSLVGLGVSETVRGGGDADRAVRALSSDVASCVKPAVQREPMLTGTMSFRIESGVGAPIMPATGSLATLPLAACIRDALKPLNASAAIDYTLTFQGSPNPAPVPAGAKLRDDWLAVDWAAGAGTHAPDLTSVGERLRERFLRCAFAAEPALSERLWLTGRVAKGGGVTLGVAKPGDASDCIQRALRNESLPDTGRDYAFTVVLRPSIEEPPPAAEYPAGMVPLIGDGGFGGLGLTGVGAGGGDGIGLGSIGVIGSGTGVGQGFGNGRGGLGGTHRENLPSVKMGATTVAGRLPPEVIQRIVRSHFGRFRLCYEAGLQNDPSLAGKVSVTFEITRKGDPAKIAATSDLHAPAVVACVEKAFSLMSFPAPEGGVVRVTYPILFAPSDDVAAKPRADAGPPAPRSVAGKPIATVQLADIERRLRPSGYEIARVPGDAPVLFIRDEPNDRLYSLSLEAAGQPARDAVCTVADESRQLIVRGAGCRSLMTSLLD